LDYPAQRTYRFRCRLLEKANQLGSTIHVKTEEYTSKTCLEELNLLPQDGRPIVRDQPTSIQRVVVPCPPYRPSKSVMFAVDPLPGVLNVGDQVVVEAQILRIRQHAPGLGHDDREFVTRRARTVSDVIQISHAFRQCAVQSLTRLSYRASDRSWRGDDDFVQIILGEQSRSRLCC